MRGEFSQDVDAAIATLYVGTKYLKEVQEIGPIRGVHDITHKDAHTPAKPFKVRKRGIRTRLTEGTVRLLDFATTTKGVDDGFKRLALRLVLIQPKTLFQGPITAIQNNGVIRVDNARFRALGIDKNKHVIEISGPTRSRGLYKINDVKSDTEIVPAHPLAPDFHADLTPQNQPAFTPVNQFIFTPTQNIVQANGLGANNPGLLPLDMLEIRKSESNNGIFQVQPIGNQPISDQAAVYEVLAQEGAKMALKLEG